MKNIFKSILVLAAAAATFASCQNEAFVEQDNLKTVNFVAQSLETKTTFGTPSGNTYPTLWTANDSKVKVAINCSTVKDANLSAASDGKTATFSLQVDDHKAESYIFDVVSPASAALSISSEKGWNISVPTTQTPLANSVDENAQVLTASSKSFSTFPEEVSLNFNHFTAYGKLTISNLQSGASVSSITLTAESNWAGRWYYKDGVATENSASATITLNTTSTSDVWFACAPVDLGGKTIKVTVATDKGNFEKTITVPSGKKFESGKIAAFTVNFSGVKPAAEVVYSLVKNTDALTAGSEVIIVGFGKVTEAISTTQNTSNRGAAGVTVISDQIKNPSEAVQIFTLEAGKYTNSVAFNTGSGYIYASSSSSNQLKTETTLSNNSSFEIKVAADTASVVAQGANTRNIIRYNDSGSSGALFSCYSNTGQNPIKIFKKDGSGTSTKLINGPVVKDDDKPTPKVYGSLAELVAAGTPTAEGETVTVTLTDEEIVDIFVTSGSGYRNGVFINVGDRQIEIFCYDVPENWEIGGRISGTVTCTWLLYGGSTWELKPSSWSAFTYTPATGLSTASVSFSPAAVSVYENANASVAVTTDYDGTLSVSSVDSGVATASISGKTITVKGVKAGSTTINVTGPATSKFNAVSTSFNVTVSKQSSASAKYVKVTSTSQLTDGKYLIVYEGGTTSKGVAVPACAFNGALDPLDAVSNSISVSPDGGQIESNSTTDAAAFTFTASNGAFLGTGGKYFGHSKDENKLTSSATPLSNTVSIASDGSADIICQGGAYLRYNYASDQMRFRFYKTSSYTNQQPIALYKLSD